MNKNINRGASKNTQKKKQNNTKKQKREAIKKQSIIYKKGRGRCIFFKNRWNKDETNMNGE